jgi:hypothetical protein
VYVWRWGFSPRTSPSSPSDPNADAR